MRVDVPMMTTSVACPGVPESSSAGEDGRAGVSRAGVAKNQDGSTEGVSGSRSSCFNRGSRRGEGRSLMGEVTPSPCSVTMVRRGQMSESGMSKDKVPSMERFEHWGLESSSQRLSRGPAKDLDEHGNGDTAVYPGSGHLAV